MIIWAGPLTDRQDFHQQILEDEEVSIIEQTGQVNWSQAAEDFLRNTKFSHWSEGQHQRNCLQVTGGQESPWE